MDRLRIAYTSDIHFDITPNNRKIIPYIVDHVNFIKPDIFIIAGDCANSLSDLNDLFFLLKDISSKIIFISGNHDVWVESKNQVRKGKDSFYKYNTAIKNLCNEYNIIYPIDEILYKNNTAIFGTIGWYDYSLKDERLNFIKSDYDKGEFDLGYWNDSKYTTWLKNPNADNWKNRNVKLRNDQVFEYFLNKFKDLFRSIPEKINNIIIISHTAMFKDCITPKEKPSPFDAYEGSVKYGEFLVQNSENKNIFIICGHRHQKLNLHKDNIQILRSPIGYLDYKVEDFIKLTENSIGVFDV